MVEYLFQQGEISKGTFRKGARLKSLDMHGVQGVESDLMDHHSLHEAVEGADTVFSLASPMPGSGGDFEKVNTEGLMHVLEAAQELGVKTLVHLSTVDVCGFGVKGDVTPDSPTNPAPGYQRAKLDGERVLREFAARNQSPRIVIVRAAKAFGAREPTFVIPVLKMMGSGKVTVPGTPSMSWSHPKDIAQAMLKAATKSDLKGNTFLVKSFDATPESLARSIIDASGSAAAVRKEGMFSRSDIARYASDQMKASLHFPEQEGWGDLGYKPEYDVQKSAADVAQWHKKEPWVTESQ